MPNLEMKLSHLKLADQHIVQARALLAAAEERAAVREQQGLKLEAADHSLRVMKRTLAVFEDHRESILRAIDDIQTAG